MSDVKLPLPVRKEIRDSEAKKNELLSEATTAVGSPVTMEMKLEESYANLASNASAQKDIVATTLSYLQHTVAALKKAYADPMVKADLEGAWTTHKFAVLAIPDDKWDAVCADASSAGDRYNRLRIKDGELQSLSPVGGFGNYASDIKSFDLTPLAAAAGNTAQPGSSTTLSLAIRKQLRDADAQLQTALGRIRALKGLEDAKVDADEVAQKAVAAGVKEFQGQHVALYIEKLADLLTKAWGDDMTSEALLDEWKAPHLIEIVPEVDLWETKGSKIVRSGSYNALRLEGGKLQLLSGKGYWNSYLSDIPGLDIASIL